MAERPVLEAVIFDAGGTLVRLDFEWMSDWLTREGVRVSASALRDAEVEGRRRYDESAAAPHPDEPGIPPMGRAGDTHAYLGGTLDAAGVPASIRARATQAFLVRHQHEGLWSRPVEGARAVLDGLGATGLRLCCVSNSDGRAEQHLEHCGMRHGLEFVVDSAIVGFEKPDPRIFQVALDRMRVPAARAVYVGDIRCVDEAGSRNAGMHFVLIDPRGDYGPAGGLSVREIAELPALLASRFAPHVGMPRSAAERR
jgi:putative hydrolase of the HAD superfamily